MAEKEIIGSYRELPLGSWMDIQSICKDESLEDLDRQVKIISILTGLTENQVLNLPIPKYKEYVIASRFLERESPDNHTRCAKSYRIGGYKCIPLSDYRKLSVAQYVDFQTFSKMGEDYFVQMLSCFLVPEGMTYNKGYDIVELQEAMREDLSVADALTLSAFFFKRCVLSIKDTLTFLHRVVRELPKEKRAEVEEKLKMLENRLLTNGDGLRM